MRSVQLALLLIAVEAAIRNFQDICQVPPENGFITAQQMDFICEHKEHWMKESQDKSISQDKTRDQMAYLSSIEACTRDNCVKETRRRKREPSKGIRKEIRMLSTEEKTLLFDAMNKLKQKMIDNITAWDLHTLVHYPDSAPGAHWGPAFLPWHREFLRQFEIALQQEHPSVTLPYWDSTLDQGLPDPADSVLFSEEFVGNGNGYVRTGPFATWDTNVYMPLSQIPVKKLYRSTGGRASDRLMNPNDVEWIISRNNYSDLTFCHDKTFESMHGLSHVWVGGFMYVIRVSPNDPMFYFHHAFVDYLWEQFRRGRQSREERERQWATKTCNHLHGYDAQMKPFRIQNRDGLSNQYTDEWYDYMPVRHCSPMEPECDSQFYWCDRKTWRCRSKVVLGGNCTGYEGEKICFNSHCQQGKCTVPPRILAALKSRLPQPVVPFGDVVWSKTVLIGQDGFGIQSDMARITVTDVENSQMRVSYHENSSYPELPGTIYMPLPKPRAGSLRHVQLEARDGFGRYCQAHCYNATVERFQVCLPNLTIGYRPETSSNIAYTHSLTSRRYLDVDLSKHPREVEVGLPFIVFACSRKLMTSNMIKALTTHVRAPIDREQFVWFRVAVHYQVHRNLQIEVVSSDGESWSSSLRRAVSPFDPQIVFVQAPNPALHPEGVSLRVTISEDDHPAQCRIKCTMKDGSTSDCGGTVELHNEAARSDEDIFTSDQSQLQLLGWKMQGHPAHWRHKVPFLTFSC